MNPMIMASNLEAMQQSEFFNNMNGGDPGSEIMSFMAGNGGQMPTGQMPTGQRPTGQRPTGQRPTGQAQAQAQARAQAGQY